MNQILAQIAQVNNETEEQSSSPQTVKLDIEKSVNDFTSVDCKDTHDLEKASETPEAVDESKGERKRREIFKCPHTDRKHYAKNMCHNCYHRKGKTKMATVCGHTHKSHYSSGMCQNCYLAKYYLKRKNKQAEKSKKAESSEDDQVKEAATPLKVAENSTDSGDDLQTSAKRQKQD